MKFELRDYQIKGVEALVNSKRFLLLDEQGLGKTVQSLEASKVLGEDYAKLNFLWVTEASLVLDAIHKIKEWFQDEDFEVIEIKNNKSQIILSKKYRFVVCSYHFVRDWSKAERLAKCRWHIICCDEAQALANPESLTYKNFVQILDKQSADVKVWWMSGTLARTKGEQYYNALQLVAPGKWGSYKSFRWNYCERKHNGFGWQFGSIAKGKRKILQEAFKSCGLRRLQKDYVKELPPVTFQDIFVAVDYVGEPVEIDPVTGLFVSGMSIKRALTDMQAVGLGKVSAAIEFISNIGRPVVVFCIHKAVVKGVVDGLVKRKFKVGKITGDESREEKFSTQQEFQAGSLDVVVCNIEAAGKGRDLYRAADMVFVEIPVSPSDYAQACRRIVRIGQKASVINIYNLLAENSYDLRVTLPKLKYRAEAMAEVMGDN